MTWTIETTELGHFVARERENNELRSVRLVNNLNQLPQSIFAAARLETTEPELETKTLLYPDSSQLQENQQVCKTEQKLATPGQRLETHVYGIETKQGSVTSCKILETAELETTGAWLEIDKYRLENWETGLETSPLKPPSDLRLETTIETFPVSSGPKNILGWSIRRNNRGYWMAYRKINGKLRSIHLGREMDSAEEKIQSVTPQLLSKELADKGL